MTNINRAAVLNPFPELTTNILDYVPRATTTEFGIVAIGAGVKVDALGRIYLDTQDISDRVDTIKAEVDTALAAYVGGRKAYKTLALAQAAQSSLSANTAIEVTNDPTSSNNGTYQWDGTTLTKSTYDPVGLANKYTDAKLSESVYTPRFKPIEGIITVNDYIIDTFQNNPIYKPTQVGNTLRFLLKQGIK